MTSYYQPRTLQVQEQVNQRSTVTFNLIDKTGSGLGLAAGQPLQLYDNSGALFFGGVLHQPQQIPQLGTSAIIWQVDAVDNQAIAERHLIIETYDNTLAGTIAKDLITNYFAADGIVAGDIQDGPTIVRAVFPYEPGNTAMDDLAQLAGYNWSITPDSKLNFGDGSTNLAPWNVTATSPIRNLTVNPNQQQYRNKQYIRGGQDVTSPQTQKFAGDGQNQTFTVAYPLAQTPTLSINGTAVDPSTVGIQGVDTGKAWYWNKNSQTISQDSSQTPLTSTDVLSITYQGYFPVLVVAEAAGAISDRAAIEGTTGVYENLVIDSSLDNSDAAMNAAQAYLAKYAKVLTEVQFDTDKSGLEIGQLIMIDLPANNVNNTQFLIDQVNIVDYTPQGDLRYTVHCIDGQSMGSWSKFFTRQAENTGQTNIRGDEVLVKLKSASDNIAVTDSFTVSRTSPESRVGYALIGSSEVG